MFMCVLSLFAVVNHGICMPTFVMSELSFSNTLALAPTYSPREIQDSEDQP